MNSTKQYVSVILMGGFGNRLFMIHAAKKYAEMTNKTFVLIKKHINDDSHEDIELTHTSLEKIFGSFTFLEASIADWIKVTDPDQNAFLYAKIPDYQNKSVLFNGYFQSPKYLSKAILPNPIQKKHNTYFLHIRLGDYCNMADFKIPLKTYYSEAILKIMEYDIDARFLIFSNENDKAKTFIQESIKVPFAYTFSPAETAYDTLVEMASCNGGICANSSLSWMAAYYMEPRHQIYMPHPWINRTKSHFGVYPDWATVVDLTK